jgi:hypothetical protein
VSSRVHPHLQPAGAAKAVTSVGRLSARDPKYVVDPQRRRLAERNSAPEVAPPESAS